MNAPPECNVHVSSTDTTGGQQSASRSPARQAFGHCPLIEIVYFHDSLRGELRSLRANVDTMRSQIGALSAAASPEGSKDSQSAMALSLSSAIHLPAEHLKLELQVQSQFRLLWAVFQSHSTAEDEIIWPALKEKARLSGGKLKLLNSDEESKAVVPDSRSRGKLSPATSAVVSGTKTCDTVSEEIFKGSEEESEPELTQERERAMSEPGGFEEAMIDEHEYAEEHSQEQRLFEGLQEVLTRLRNTRQSLPERLNVMAGLSSKTEEMCQHLMSHLAKEEESALPLIKHYFTREEMEALVGRIMGKRPTELMQTILAMMIKNLPSDEISKMMGYMRQAVKDTYFEKWLEAGGFQWPMDKAPYHSQSNGDGGRREKDGRRDDGDVPSTSVGHVSATSTSHASGVRASTCEENPRARIHKRPGNSLDSVVASIECTDGCVLRLEFSGMTLSGADPPVPDSGKKSRHGKDERATQELESLGRDSPTTDGRASDRCFVCGYIGRCPVKEPLTQQEFEAAVKKLAQAEALTAAHKNSLIQALRNHMYQGRKRPRPGGSASVANPLVRTNPGPNSTWTTGSQAPVMKGASVSRLVAPARYYTSTQPDIEEATSVPSGRDKNTVAVTPSLSSRDVSTIPKEGKGGVMFPPLFTPEELAPTYHVVGASSAGSSAPTTQTLAQMAPEDGPVRDANGSVLGCPHYRRSCKIRAPCCQQLFTCRLCHDQASDHVMSREEVQEMLCMYCGTLQPVHSECRNPGCRPKSSEVEGTRGRRMARYYCGICHLFDDAPGKDIYHCPYCNICRLGKGLGEDFFHCMKCNACVSLNAPKHNCFSKSLESDCPICGGSLFTSTSQVKGLKCGHFMHLACYKEYIRRADSQHFWYRCPICRKSIDDMEEFFSQIDAEVASQPMPESYAGQKIKVLCHDCEQYTDVAFHFVYLKCGVCGSYNTRTEGKALRAAEGVTDDRRQ